MKYQKEDILNDQVFKNFLDHKNIDNNNTIIQYETRIKSYCNFTEKTTTELIDEAIEEQNNSVKSNDRKVNKYLQDFINKLTKKSKSENTIKAYYDTIKALYYDNDIELQKIEFTFNKNVQNTFEELPNKEHILKALKYCNLRDKAIILLQFSSGLSAAEIRHLTYGQFFIAIKEYINFNNNEIFNIDKIYRQLKNKDNIIGIWNSYESNTDIDYLTFNSSESNKAIIDYLLERNNKKPITSFNEPLFIANGNKIGEHTLSAIYRRINQRAGLGSRNEKRNFLTSNIPRKMFQRALLECDVEYLAIELMLGHKIDNIKLAYYKNNPEILKKEYLKGLRNITLEEVEIVTTDRYDNIILELKIEKDERIKLENRIKKLEDEKQNSKNIKNPDFYNSIKDNFEKYRDINFFKNIKKPR
ncbi:site-specific integrase [Methanobacterium sp. SMA-27]|uniref:site-specific integrase n=1 Tax=Methanobacterium sp. SMA-27 TaxID=1495336 RepID=UPI00064E4D45|nr:site-specific integrase [Methanobacterium sp. SMA-27]